MSRVIARCVSCGAEAVRDEPGLLAVLTHKDNCPTMPVLCKLSNSELWQFYVRMNHVVRTHPDAGVVEDARTIKTDIIRDIKRRNRIRRGD